jgi:hypothetical protein
MSRDEFTHNCAPSIGMIAVMALLDEDPLVFKVATINDASVQCFNFFCQSNRVVFDFREIRTPCMKLGYF